MVSSFRSSFGDILWWKSNRNVSLCLSLEFSCKHYNRARLFLLKTNVAYSQFWWLALFIFVYTNERHIFRSIQKSSFSKITAKNRCRFQYENTNCHDGSVICVNSLKRITSCPNISVCAVRVKIQIQTWSFASKCRSSISCVLISKPRVAQEFHVIHKRKLSVSWSWCGISLCQYRI